mgnify:CR=1 FL=1
MFFMEQCNDMRKREHKQNLSLNSEDLLFSGIAPLRDLLYHLCGTQIRLFSLGI